MARVGVAALCLVLVACVELGSCTHCYQCISSSDPGCADPFSLKNSLKDCSNVIESTIFNTKYVTGLDPELLISTAGKPRYCHKIVTQSGIVIRSCFDGDAANPNATCARLEQKGRDSGDASRQLKYCGFCNKDNCNGAGAPIASLSLALVATVLAYLSYRQ